MYRIIGVEYTIFGEKYTIFENKDPIGFNCTDSFWPFTYKKIQIGARASVQIKTNPVIRFLRRKVYDYKCVKYTILRT